MIAVIHSFSFKAIHAPGVDNRAADALSRFNISLFRSLMPQANEILSLVSPELYAIYFYFLRLLTQIISLYNGLFITGPAILAFGLRSRQLLSRFAIISLCGYLAT